jgi:ketosteroid isomerase-like protein
VDLHELREHYEAWNRRDVDALLAVARVDVEIHPLAASLTSIAPWVGHDGLQRLVEDTDRRWHRFELRCDDLLDMGDRVVAFVHVSTAVDAEGPVIEGDIAHLIELVDGRLLRLTAFRERDDAIAAAQRSA